MAFALPNHRRLNWRSFNTSAGETVNFVQPSASAIAVNRILDTSGTQFFGRLQANGQVYLINPNGILFGASAQGNVGGPVASTRSRLPATVIALGFTSFFTDVASEMVFPLLPAFLLTLGAGPTFLGVLEGVLPLAMPNTWVPVIEFLLFVVILLVKPSGLLGGRQ